MRDLRAGTLFIFILKAKHHKCLLDGCNEGWNSDAERLLCAVYFVSNQRGEDYSKAPPSEVSQSLEGNKY